MTRPPIEQHMRVTVCRWCGALATECNGSCTHGTELITLSRPLADAACIAEIVINYDKADVIELPCQQHQSGTGHTDTSTDDTRTGHPQPSVDTTDTGPDCEDCSSSTTPSV